MLVDTKRVLAIGAHPDDLEYGCLGYLLKLAASSELHLFCASLGSAGAPSSGEARYAETMSALSVLNAENFWVRKKKGIDEHDFGEVLRDLEGMVDEVAPSLILVHSPHDTHQEHELCYRVLMSASRRRKVSILRYFTVSSTSAFRPDFFVELTEDVLNTKIGRLRCHKSQSDKQYMQPDFIKGFHAFPFTTLHGMDYCEAYEVERIMHAS